MKDYLRNEFSLIMIKDRRSKGGGIFIVLESKYIKTTTYMTNI